MSRPGKIASLLLRSLFKKPATVDYPLSKPPMPEGFRGKLKFHAQLCIGCKMCMRDCPAGAIEINKLADGKFEARVDLGRCIYCGQCADSCLKKALELSREFELASLKREALKIVLDDHTKENPEK
jgi:formate hydrogenlyase subunit 6/NADH:ubiquinone oxidoreductase subunit I